MFTEHEEVEVGSISLFWLVRMEPIATQEVSAIPDKQPAMAP